MPDFPLNSHPGGWRKNLLLHLQAYRLCVASVWQFIIFTNTQFSGRKLFLIFRLTIPLLGFVWGSGCEYLRNSFLGFSSQDGVQESMVQEHTRSQDCLGMSLVPNKIPKYWRSFVRQCHPYISSL